MIRKRPLVNSAETASLEQRSPALLRTYGNLGFHTDGDVIRLAFGPDGQLFSMEEPGVLRCWDVARGEAVRTQLLSDLATLWRFSSDGSIVAGAADEIALWDTRTGEPGAAIAQPDWVSAVAINPRTGLVAAGHDEGVVRLWDFGRGKMLRELGGHDRPISVLVFSPDGTRLASAGEDRLICLWDVDSGKCLGTLQRHTDHIEDLAWHPNGTILFSAGWDRTARVWDTSTLQALMLLNSHGDQVTAIACSADGSTLACADSDGSVRIWDVGMACEWHVFSADREETRALAFSPDGRMLAAGGAGRLIRLWDCQQGKPIWDHPASVNGRSSLALLDEGSLLVSDRGASKITVWNRKSGLAECRFDGLGAVQCFAASSDGKEFAAWDGERLRCWDVGNDKEHFCLDGQNGKVCALAFGTQSQWLASATNDGTVWIWDMKTREPILVIPDAVDGCTPQCMAFQPGDRLLAVAGIDWLATGGSDGAICLWNVVDRQLAGNLPRATRSMAFHPNGNRLASVALEAGIIVWQIHEQSEIRALNGPVGPTAAVVYSPDGAWLVAGGDDRLLHIWEANTGRLKTTQRLESPVQGLHFSPDGGLLFSSNGNTTCYEFDFEMLLG